MDDKSMRRRAELCARCCACCGSKKRSPSCAHCVAYKCKVLCKCKSKSKSKSKSSSPSEHETAPAAATHVSSSAASPPKTEPASVVASQTDVVKPPSKKSQQSASEPAAVSSGGNGASAELEGLQPAPGEPERTYGIVVDGLDVAKFRDRDGFRSVNLVRALKYLYKKGMKPVAFVPRSYVDFRSKDAKLADDPCVLKHIQERDNDLLRFIDDKELYAWEMLTFAKNHNLPILSNRRYEQKRKVKTPSDVEVPAEELEALYLYVHEHRMPYSFKGMFVLK